jgi:uncharacterized membrane-anchored protein
MDTFFLIHITNKANLTKTIYNQMEKVLSSMGILCLLGLSVLSCQNEKKEHSEKTHPHVTAKTVIDVAVPKEEKQLPPGNDIYAQVAVETCNCLSPMLEKAEEADRLMKENQQSKVGQILEDVEKLRPKAEICSAEIKAKYSNLNSARDQKKILEALNKYCPESAALLRKTLSMNFTQ